MSKTVHFILFKGKQILKKAHKLSLQNRQFELKCDIHMQQVAVVAKKISRKPMHFVMKLL